MAKEVDFGPLGKALFGDDGTIQHAPMMQVDGIILERFCVAIREVLSCEHLVMGDISIKMLQDHIARKFFVDLRAWLVAKHQPNVRSKTSIQLPRDWWEYFKERWFPKWALRRWPVQTMAVEQSRSEQTVKVCPHLETDGEKTHLKWLTKSEQQDEIEETKFKYRAWRLLMNMTDPKSGPPGDSLYYEVSPRVQEAARAVLGLPKE